MKSTLEKYNRYFLRTLIKYEKDLMNMRIVSYLAPLENTPLSNYHM